MDNLTNEIFTLCKDSLELLSVNTIVLEYNNKHIEVDLVNKQLTYNRRTSPSMAFDDFPTGYFDTHHNNINEEVLSQIKNAVIECIRNLPFDTTLDCLPPGASRTAYMRCEDVKGNTYYYSTEHTSKNRFFVNHVPIHKEFQYLYELLLPQCEHF